MIITRENYENHWSTTVLVQIKPYQVHLKITLEQFRLHALAALVARTNSVWVSADR